MGKYTMWLLLGNRRAYGIMLEEIGAL